LGEAAAADGRSHGRAVLEELELRNPKAKGQDPKKFFDDRFVRELQSSGFSMDFIVEARLSIILPSE
jgi:hypothetical protein